MQGSANGQETHRGAVSLTGGMQGSPDGQETRRGAVSVTGGAQGVCRGRAGMREGMQGRPCAGAAVDVVAPNIEHHMHLYAHVLLAL